MISLANILYNLKFCFAKYQIGPDNLYLGKLKNGVHKKILPEVFNFLYTVFLVSLLLDYLLSFLCRFMKAKCRPFWKHIYTLMFLVMVLNCYWDTIILPFPCIPINFEKCISQWPQRTFLFGKNAAVNGYQSYTVFLIVPKI